MSNLTEQDLRDFMDDLEKRDKFIIENYGPNMYYINSEGFVGYIPCKLFDEAIKEAAKKFTDDYTKGV